MTFTLVNPYTASNMFTSNNTDLTESASEIWEKLSKKTKKLPEHQK